MLAHLILPKESEQMSLFSQSAVLTGSSQERIIILSKS